jgi:glyoxylase-like metal-dependent hydrolase (beta-lactamase superfamily II)
VTAPQPREVAPGTFRLETTVTGTSMPLALHLFEGDGWLVTDTGCVGMMRDLALPAVAALRPGSGIRHAVVSHAHADHFGGNAELLAADPDCRILVHRDDAAWAADPAWHVRDAYDALGSDYPCPVEVKAWVAALLGPPTPVQRVEAGDRIELGAGRVLQVVHLPGHAPGHLGLWEADRGLLVLHDAILGDGQREGGRVVAIPSYLDVDAYLATIRTVRTLDPALALPAHFPPLGRDALRTFCDLSEDFVRRLDEALWALLADGRPRGLPEITEHVVPEVAPGVAASMVAGLSVRAHLDAFVRHGLIAWHVEGDRRVWHRP